MKKVVWLDGQNIFVVRKGFTTNTKISNGRPLVQTYTFSVKQWQLASTRKGFEMKELIYHVFMAVLLIFILLLSFYMIDLFYLRP